MKVITIGRSSENEITINDGSVSRHHCQIVQYDNGTFAIVDFGSTNGTYVNGQRISGQQTLNPNDVVKVGNTLLPWRNYFGSASPTPNSTPHNHPIPHPVQPQLSNKTLPIILGVLGGVAVVVVLVVLFLSGGGNDNNVTDYSATTESTTATTNDVQTPIVNEPEPSKEEKKEKPNISGKWHWESDDKVDFDGALISSFIFDLDLKDEGTTICGKYESVFCSGRMDIADNPVNGKWDGEKFVVNFRSNAWGGKGKATIKQISSNKIEWTWISNQGEIHVPKKAILTK